MGKHLWLAVAMLLVGVGGPTEFGVEGRIDKAMERDTKERVEEAKGDCPAGTHQEEPKSPCPNPPCKLTCVADVADH